MSSVESKLWLKIFSIKFLFDLKDILSSFQRVNFSSKYVSQACKNSNKFTSYRNNLGAKIRKSDTIVPLQNSLYNFDSPCVHPRGHLAECSLHGHC